MGGGHGNPRLLRTLAQRQLRQLGDIRRDTSRPIFREHWSTRPAVACPHGVAPVAG
jgi:hypothetical protein